MKKALVEQKKLKIMDSYKQEANSKETGEMTQSPPDSPRFDFKSLTEHKK